MSTDVEAPIPAVTTLDDAEVITGLEVTSAGPSTPPAPPGPSARWRCFGAHLADDRWRETVHTGHDPTGAAFGDLFSLADADELLTTRQLRYPHLRVVHRGKPVPPVHYLMTRELGPHTFDDLIDPGRAIDWLADGATLVYQALDLQWPGLARFAADLAGELGQPTQVNGYLSPRQTHGLAVHYDVHDVIVLQVHGSKRWEVFPPVFEDPLPFQHWGHVRPDGGPWNPEPNGDPLLATTLGPGDSLYLPRGFVHRAHTTSDTSLHLSLGVHPRTWYDLLQRVTERAADDPRFRTALGPRDGRDVGLRDLMAGGFPSASSVDLAVDDRRDQLTGRAGYHAGRLLDVTAAIDDATTLRRRHEAVDVTVDLGELDGVTLAVVTSPDRALGFPSRVRPALERLVTGSPVRLGALHSLIDQPGRLVLARHLVAAGVCGVR